MARDRDDNSDDNNDVTISVRPRRVELLTGPERRRRWSDEGKIAIVAEALVQGVVISEVARRHDISPSQLFGWIRQFRTAAEARSIAVEPPEFAPAIVDEGADAQPTGTAAAPETVASIEITVGSVVVRIRGAVDSRTLATVLKALKVLA